MRGKGLTLTVWKIASEGQHHWLDNAFRNILFYVKTVPWDNYPRLLWFLNLTKLS